MGNLWAVIRYILIVACELFGETFHKIPYFHDIRI